MLKDEVPSPLENNPELLIRDRRDSSLYLRPKLEVGILGATGSVGQRLVQLLDKHPWMKLTAVAASEKSQGKTYKEATTWNLSTPMPQEAAKLEISACVPELPCQLVFSALSSSIAGEIEEEFAKKGYVVISMAKNHRMRGDVPLLIPEVNAEHLDLVKLQNYQKGGMIITKPNCAVIGLALALRPLALEFGIEKLNVVTMQSISGAGYPGVPSLDLLDNIIPYIQDEEEKIETETKRVLGELTPDKVKDYPMTVSASCNRVPVTEGHMEVVSLSLKEKASKEEVIRAWKEFDPPIQGLHLPSSPANILHYFEEEDLPQPKKQRDLEGGMAVSLGRLRPCPVLDHKFILLSHNTIRGAAGGAILIAELLMKKGCVYW